jgi:hypothetical protein
MATGTSIEVVEPLVRAWRRTRQLLFEPFAFERWAVFGFSAWLALWTGTGGGGNLSWIFSPPSNLPEPLQNPREELAGWLTGAAVVAIVALAALAFTFALLRVWLQSRFDFVFLNHLVTGRTDIANPWRRYSWQGNSLFAWRIILCLGFLVLLLLPVALAIGAGIRPGVVSIGALVVGALLVVPILLTGAFLIFTLNQFVVPIMAVQNLTFGPAFARFRDLLGSQPMPFVLFTLLYWVLSIAVGMVITVVGFATCCVGFLLFALPYVGAVVLLPVAVCGRYYGLEFLRQFGPEYDLLEPRAE